MEQIIALLFIKKQYLQPTEFVWAKQTIFNP